MMGTKYLSPSIYDERIGYRLTLSFALTGVIPLLLSTYLIGAIWLPGLQVWARVGLLLGCSLLISLLGYFLSRTIVRTILKTSEAAKEIADGNLSRRLEIRNERAEINTLVDSFNRITAQLEQKVKDVQASEEKVRHLLNNIPDLLYYLEPSGLISSINHEVGELLGYTEAELVGQEFSTIVHPDDYRKYEPVLKERRSDERRLTRGLHIRLKTKAGEYRDFEINSRGIYDLANVFLGTEGLARDITAQLALESEREEFLYMLTHDIKNPISAILFIIYMMRDGTISPPKYPEYYEKMERACNGVNMLVEDFLEVKKFERGLAVLDVRPTDLAPLVKEIVLTYQSEARAKQKQLSYRLHAEGESVPAVVDEKYFQRAVENLLTNAIKFSRNRIEMVVKKNQDCVEIQVSDDGPGVSDEEREHIFKLFHRSSGARMTKGIGVGLTSAERIIRAHGGSLRVDPGNGNGCSFIITLPPVSGITMPQSVLPEAPILQPAQQSP
ncbi:MAG: PAS domain S-box protein [Candidatus Abyssobacteria bacterium SURF_5]|uniref:histidine kinase n=1 Tax=Abyssobacteria bacterium (strain SURF_5) TaxID=2093360 RepID=A0A3A4NTK1_ABYX5|nr:MAG: PAS domain S-box protein [Candidatus Abyssubacteria bacterium SURF_5]